MDKTQLDKLRVEHDALLRLNELMETGHHCTVNDSRHSLTTVKFRRPLRLSDKSKNALEAMSSTMATVVKSVLSEELEEMKKSFGEIKIDGETISETPS